MAKQEPNKKKPGVSREQRKVRVQQIAFGILAAIIIFTWIITLVIH
jgi:hypothetical protein